MSKEKGHFSLFRWIGYISCYYMVKKKDYDVIAVCMDVGEGKRFGVHPR